MVRLSLVLAAALGTAATSPAMADCADILPSTTETSSPKREITVSDLIGIRDFGSNAYAYLPTISPYAVSPDGQSIAFVMTRANLAENDYCRALVVMPTNGGTPRIVDRGGDYIMLRDTQRGLIGAIGGGVVVVPAWSPDGKWLAYRKRVAGVTQVWRVRADGAGAAAATQSPTDVGRFAWASNGAIVYATRIGEIAANRAIDGEARSGWLYDGRVVTMEAWRPALRETDVPEKSFLATIDTGRTRPATVEENRSLPPDSLGGDPTAIVLTSRDGKRGGIEGISPAPFSPRRIWVEWGGKRSYCGFAACSDGVIQIWWADDGALIFQRREG